MTPLAVQIYWRFLNGETVEQLAGDLRIPADRVVERIRAAARHLDRCQAEAHWPQPRVAVRAVAIASRA